MNKEITFDYFYGLFIRLLPWIRAQIINDLVFSSRNNMLTYWPKCGPSLYRKVKAFESAVFYAVMSLLYTSLKGGKWENRSGLGKLVTQVASLCSSCVRPTIFTNSGSFSETEVVRHFLLPSYSILLYFFFRLVESPDGQLSFYVFLSFAN